MSRGLGRWQQLLLDAVNEHTPEERSFGFIFGLDPMEWLFTYLGREPTIAEMQAVYRAARTLTARGLVVRGRFGAQLFKADDRTNHLPHRRYAPRRD